MKAGNETMRKISTRESGRAVGLLRYAFAAN
jgi:hypothetical protein